MTDLIMFLIFVIFGIIAYQLVGLLDGFIGRHTADSDKPEMETKENEPVDAGKPERARFGLPVFLNVQRKSHSRGF